MSMNCVLNVSSAVEQLVCDGRWYGLLVNFGYFAVIVEGRQASRSFVNITLSILTLYTIIFVRFQLGLFPFVTFS